MLQQQIFKILGFFNLKNKGQKKKIVGIFIFLVFVLLLIPASFNKKEITSCKTETKIFSISFVVAQEAYSQPTINQSEVDKTQAQDQANKNSPGLVGGLLLPAFKWLLYGVFVFVSWLMGVAAILLGWVIKTDNIKLVLDNDAIYESWKMVRDMLNLAFILVLLFSAFCTIFQVEKYHLKKILLTLVIMALLVNFSFPVSRFIIDVSNVMFYFIINSVFPNTTGEGVFGSIASHAGIVDILKPQTSQVKNADVWYLIAIIVFTFILMITFLVIAVMFVIRLVALGIIIIFSPIGFVAAIFPSTKHYADDWWSNLFKYSFFAPIMAFMLAIALNILGKMKSDALTGFLTVTQNNIGGNTIDASVVAKMAFFAIPIVILWMGLITAQKLSIAGAGVVTGQAKKFAGWAGRLPWRGIKTAAVATGVPGGLKQKYENIASRFKAAREQREAVIAGKGPFKVAGAKQKDMQRRSDEYKKNFESIPSLQQKCSAGDAAACHRLAVDGEMDHVTYGNMQTRVTDPELKKVIDGKVKEKHLDVIVRYKIQQNPANAQNIIRDEYGNLTAEEWANQKNLHLLVDPNNTPQNNPNSPVHYDQTIAQNAPQHFNNLSPDARIESSKKMSGNKASILRNNNFHVP